MQLETCPTDANKESLIIIPFPVSSSSCIYSFGTTSTKCSVGPTEAEK